MILEAEYLLRHIVTLMLLLYAIKVFVKVLLPV